MAALHPGQALATHDNEAQAHLNICICLVLLYIGMPQVQKCIHNLKFLSFYFIVSA